MEPKREREREREREGVKANKMACEKSYKLESWRWGGGKVYTVNTACTVQWLYFFVYFFVLELKNLPAITTE